MKKWRSFVLQKIRKVGYFGVARLQFLCRYQRRFRLLRVAVDSQPCDLPMAIFSYLLQQKIAPIFQIKPPLFCRASREFFGPSPGPAQSKMEPTTQTHTLSNYIPATIDYRGKKWGTNYFSVKMILQKSSSGRIVLHDYFR